MTIKPTIWIAAVAVAVIASTAVPTAHADGKNEVRAVTFDEDAGITRVHVRGAQTPTFTVYKLERPSRVVIDLPQARLADALKGHESGAMFTPSTWAVSAIAAQQLDDGAVRVIVTLARPGRYDVKTDGNEVIVMVMPRDPVPKTADPAELARAQAESEEARQQAKAADAARIAAQQQADAASATAKQSRLQVETADAARIAAQQQADAASATVKQSRQQVETANAARDAAKAEAERLRKMAADQAVKAEAAQRAVDQARQLSAADLERAKATADQARGDAETAKAAATKAQAEMERTRAGAEQARHDAVADADRARAEAAKARDEVQRTRAEAARAQAETKQQAAAAIALAKSEAARARADAETARATAADDKRKAEVARGDADKLLKDAKVSLATLDKKTTAAQQLEDKARSANAAAEAREEAARDSVARAESERATAETEAKQAQAARDRAAASDRSKLAADAKLAADRLAQAKQLTAEAEQQRLAAERAASIAKQDLEQTKRALSGVEQQRTVAMAAASDAARKRTEAEAAAVDAARRRVTAETARKEAELAATEAAQRKSQADRDRAEAESRRVASVEAAHTADQQRVIAETAVHAAVAAKHDAEASLAELTTRRQAAEQAAADLEARAKAEAKAQAEVIAAQSRKASDREIATARVELARLGDQRKHAETELADRRKAVSLQQAEAARLETTAAEARDASAREEARRAKLADQRATDEVELAKLEAQKVRAQVQVKVAEADAAKPAVAPTPAAKSAKSEKSDKSTKPVAIAAISFKGDDGNGLVDIAVGADADVQLGDVTSSRVELIVDHAELATKLERTLDVSKFGSPVKSVSTFRDRHAPNRVRLIAELAQAATATVERDGNDVRWHFISADIAKRPIKVTNVPSPVVGGFGAASTPLTQQSVTQLPPQGTRRRIYHGATVDFDFKDAPIHDLLRVIADTGHINIVVPDSVDAKVTVRLKRVPWDEALEVILASHGLWYRREGNLYRIANRKELDNEDDQEAARIKASVEHEQPRTEVVTLNYASAEELRGKLEHLKSPKGSIEVDARTNSLIINDIAGNRGDIIKLALGLDTQTPEISIEARIVEANSTFTREFGVQWGGNAIAGAAGGNATGLIFPSSVAVQGANEDQSTNHFGVASPSDYAVNLPAGVGTGEGGALGLSLGSIGGNLNLNLKLSALEDTGTVRIISAPKVTVLNNKEAKISQGVSIPISVVSAAGTNTQFVQADLSLAVTPYVSQRDCRIAMQLIVTKNAPDFSNTGARGDPTIQRKEARTSMLVADGDTAVLGGIYTRNASVAYKKIPVLGDLPVIGWLFKNRREEDDRTEILVFITPKITNKASLRCTQ